MVIIGWVLTSLNAYLTVSPEAKTRNYHGSLAKKRKIGFTSRYDDLQQITMYNISKYIQSLQHPPVNHIIKLVNSTINTLTFRKSSNLFYD